MIDFPLFLISHNFSLKVPRTVMETQTIEPKAVTYHVTKYVYPNMSGEINPQDTLEGSQHLFPDARRGLGGTYNQPQDAYNYRNTNSYGLYGGSLTRPGPNGSSAGPGPKPYSSAGPYTSLQAPFISTVGPNLSNTFIEPTVFGNGTIFPSFTQGIPQVNDIFQNRNSPTKLPNKSAYYQNGVLTVQRQ